MSESADRVRELLEQVSSALGLGASVEIEEEGREIRGTLDGEDLGLFIGRHGQTIDAVQHLAFKAATKDRPPASGVRVVIDAAGYRERRELRSNIEGFAPTYARELTRGGHARLPDDVPPDDPTYLALIAICAVGMDLTFVDRSSAI